MSISVILREHPDTGEEVGLTVEYFYTEGEQMSWEDPGANEEWEIATVQDSKGNYYSDELVWTDDQIIEGLKQC